MRRSPFLIPLLLLLLCGPALAAPRPGSPTAQKAQIRKHLSEFKLKGFGSSWSHHLSAFTPADTQVKAAEALAQIGTPALPALRKELGRKDPERRYLAVRALGLMDLDEATELLLQTLAQDPFWGVQGAAAHELAKQREPRAQAPLLDLLRKEGLEPRWTLLRHVVAFPSNEAVAYLTPLVGIRKNFFMEFNTGAFAAQALAGMGDPGRDALFKAAASSNPWARRYALSGLTALKTPEAVARIVAATKDESAQVRAVAVQACDELRHPQTLPLVREALHDPQPEVSRGACEILCERLGKEATPELIALVRNRTAGVEVLAILKLGEWQVKEAVPALLETISRTEAGYQAELLRGDAAAALGRIGGEGLLEPLLKFLDQGTLPRMRGLSALAELKDPRAIPHVRKFLSNPHPGTVNRAATCLAALGDRESIPAILQALKNSKPSLGADELIQALGQLRAAEALPTLRRFARYKGDDYTRTQDAEAAQKAIQQIEESTPLK